VVRFLQFAHRAHERFTVRDGINIARYALKVMENEHLLKKVPAPDRPVYSLRMAVEMILGDKALVYFKG
jgi:MoxR-like ATPase